MSYKKVYDIEDRMKNMVKNVTVCGLVALSGYFAKDISTHTTYEQLDNGHYGSVKHIDGAEKSVATLGAAAFLALGAKGRQKIKEFTKNIFAAEGGR